MVLASPDGQTDGDEEPVDPDINSLTVRLLRLSAMVIILWMVTLTAVQHRGTVAAQVRDAYVQAHDLFGIGPEND